MALSHHREDHQGSERASTSECKERGSKHTFANVVLFLVASLAVWALLAGGRISWLTGRKWYELALIVPLLALAGLLIPPGFDRLRLRMYYRYFPEARLFYAHEQRRARVDDVRGGRLEFVYCTVLLLIGLRGLFFLLDLMPSYVPWCPRWAGAAMLVPVCGFASFGSMWVVRRKVRSSFRRRLIEVGIPVCIDCGYDLRGQVELRCPECGKEFDAGLLRKHGGETDSAENEHDVASE